MNFKKFTMTELLIVIVMGVIIASVVVPNVWNFKESNIMSAVKVDEKTLDKAIERYIAENKDYPTKDNKRPILGQYKILDLAKLVPEYIKRDNFNKNVTWLVDYKLKVYPVFLDIESDALIENTTISLPLIKEKVNYKIVEVNYKGVAIKELQYLNEDSIFSNKIKLDSFETNNENTYAALVIEDDYGFTSPAIFRPDEELLKIEPIIKLNNDPHYRKSHEVTVDVHNNDNVSKIEYSISRNPLPVDSKWTEVKNNTDIEIKDLTGTYYVHVQAVETDEEIVGRSTVRYLDNEKPIINILSDKVASKEHIVLVKATDNIELQSVEYQWSTQQKTSVENWIPLPDDNLVKLSGVTGTRYLHVKAVDLAGNVSYSVESRLFDPNSPTILIEDDFTYAKNHVVHVEVIPAGTSIMKVEYAWSRNLTPPLLMPNIWGLEANLRLTSWEYFNNLYGPYYLHIKVTDWRGRVTNKYTIRYFDGERPKIKLNADSNVAQSHSVLLSATDNHRVEKIEYVWTDTIILPENGWQAGELNGYALGKGFDGLKFLHVRAYDEAGNVDYDNVVRYFDNKAPEIRMSRSNLVLRTHSVEVLASDLTGVDKLEYKWTKNSIQPTVGWINAGSQRRFFKSDGTGILYLHLKATDKVGNVSYSYVSRKFQK